MVGKKRLSTIEQRVLQFVRRHNLVSAGQKMLVAVSGGADSVCLLQVMVNLKDVLGVGLYVAHLDHRLRGADSEADARYVSDLARSLGVPATVEQRDVRGYRAEHRLSLEEAAREVRYSFFTQVSRETGCDRVAVGHTLDDHIETVMMHIIRGAGTRGLIGLRPEVLWRTAQGNLTVTRPLLEISREETAEYCSKCNLSPRMDVSNLSLSLFRNRIRRELLPLLKSYNPQIAEALVRAGRIACDDLNYIEEQTARLWNEVAQERKGIIVLSKRKLLELPPALQRSLLRVSIEKLLGTLKDIEMRHIEEIMAALDKPAGKRLNLPFGLVFVIEYDRYLLSVGTEQLSPFPSLEGEFTINIPGETTLSGWHVKSAVMDSGRAALGESGFTAHFDLDRVRSTLTVRSRRRGDRFQPLGMSETKKLGEFMVDARIPQAWRAGIPVVCSGQQIIWVVGWRIDDRFRVTENTKLVLQLSFQRC